MRSLILMLQFFTRIPIPIAIDMDEKTTSRGILFFPLVGVIVGAIGLAANLIFRQINNDIGALAAVAATVAATGGLHLDGLSDTCDGFFSARSRERILEIMKDSRVGTFGAIAIVLDLLSRYILIRSLDKGSIILAFIFVYGASRLGAAMLISFGRPARDNGLAKIFDAGKTRIYFYISGILFALIGFIFGKWIFAAILISVLIAFLLLMRRSYKIIGGLTGDVYGAGIEIAEIAGLLILCILQGIKG